MMQERMTAEQFRALAEKKRSKYGNRRVEYEGMRFDSQAELNRYLELVSLRRAGAILSFTRQPSFIIIDGPEPVRYRADCLVFDGDGVHVEDVKGARTKDFEIKRKLWARVYPHLPLVVIPAGRA